MYRALRKNAIPGLAGLVLLACSGGGGTNDDAGAEAADGAAQAQDGPAAAERPAEGGGDGGLGCCPAGFTLYACELPDAGAGLACHNPAMGCASSTICGQGCDPQVGGRCACVQTELCIAGDHFDPGVCKCVADQDASAPGDARPCVDNVLCIVGDHFDPALCRCVPDQS